jgi:hypothetical protein
MLEAADAACLGEGGLLLQEGDVVVVEERPYQERRYQERRTRLPCAEEEEGEEAAAGGSRGAVVGGEKRSFLSRTLALLQRIGFSFFFPGKIRRFLGQECVCMQMCNVHACVLRMSAMRVMSMRARTHAPSRRSARPSSLL